MKDKLSEKKLHHNYFVTLTNIFGLNKSKQLGGHIITILIN